MNILYALLVCVCCIGCYGQNKGLNNQQRNQNLQSITRPLNVSKEAQLIDLGFDASPVYFWVKYEGKLKEEGKRYPHIAVFKFFNEKGTQTYFRYYEWNNSRSLSNEVDFNEFKFVPYPGDGTVKLVSGQKDFFLFNVLENHKFDRVFKGTKYFRIPTVTVNSQGLLVSDDEIEVNISKKNSQIYSVTFLNHRGEKAFKYKLKGCSNGFDAKLSYFNKETGIIFFIERGCYLEPIK